LSEKRIKPGKVLKSVSILSSGAFLGMAISVVAAPITSRLFPPEAFGLAAVFAAFYSVVGPIATLRYDKAILLPDKEEDASNLLIVGILFSLLSTILLFVVFHYWGYSILTMIHANGLVAVSWLFPLGVLAYSIRLPLASWLVRRERFKDVTKARVAWQSIVSGGTILGGALGYNSGVHLTGVRLMGFFTLPLYLLVSIIKNKAERPLSFNLRGMYVQIKRHWKFPAFSTFESLFESTGREAPVFVLAYFFSQSLVGNYSRAIMLVGIPFQIFGMALEQVYYQQASKLHAQGKDIKRLTKNVYTGILKYTFAPFLLLVVTGPELFQIILGGPWREAGVYAALIAPFILSKLLFIPIGNVYNVYERQGMGFIFTLLLLLIQSVTLIIGSKLGSARFALAGYSAGGVLVMVGLGIWSLKTAKVRLSFALIVFFKTLALACVTILPSFLLKNIYHAPTLWVILAGIAGVGVYYFVALYRDADVRNLLSSYLNRNDDAGD